MLTDRQKKYIESLSPDVANKPTKIYPWSEEGMIIAQEVIDGIYSVAPELEIHLLGSLPLKIAGQKDIDITIPVDAKSFNLYIEKFELIFGTPKVREDSVVWHFDREGYDVGIYIIDPTKSDQLERQKYMFEMFKSNPELLSQYENLKLSLNDVPYIEYLRKKCEFLTSLDNDPA